MNKPTVNKPTYGIGQDVEFAYDNLDRITQKKFGGIVKATYEYDASGNLGISKDIDSGTSYTYFYDAADRLTKLLDTVGNTTNFQYDKDSKLKNISENLNGSAFSTTYTYDKDNRPIETAWGTNKVINSYTEPNSGTPLERLTSRRINISGVDEFVTTFNYAPGANESKTTRIASIDNDGSITSYTYELNEVIRENNQVLDKTIVYSYDVGGTYYQNPSMPTLPLKN